MATRQEAQEHIIDLILDFIIINAEDVGGTGIDLSSYRRYIDPNTGQIVTDENISSNDTSIVLYERDFRESFDEKLIEAVNEILDNCGTVSGVDYTLGSFASLKWNYVPGGTTCTGFGETFGGISFSGGNGADDYISGTTCGELVGSMTCNNNKAIELLLTENSYDNLTGLNRMKLTNIIIKRSKLVNKFVC